MELAPQPARLLEMLVRRAGQLVSREEIRQALWTEDVHVDFERSINFNIRQIRSALGDDPASPRFIETVPRHGYRFVAEVDRKEETPGERKGASRWRFAVLLALPLLGLVARGLIVHEPGRQDLKSGETVEATPLEDETAGLSPASADDYRIGRRLLERGRPAAWEKAAEAFRRVGVAEPEFGKASSGLSYAVLFLGDPVEAKASAERALELDPNIAEARLVLAWLAYADDFDLAKAERLMEEALSLQPENSFGLMIYMQLLVTQGRTGEAIAAAEKLLELEPISQIGRWGMAWALFHDRQYEAAIEYAQSSKELFPARPVTPYDLWIRCLVRLGKSEEAVDLANHYLALHGWEPPPVKTLEDWWRLLLDHSGEPGEEPGGRERSRKAMLHLSLGEIEEALSLLRDACDKKFVSDLLYLRTDPRFDPIRLHPGFQEVLTCLKEPLPSDDAGAEEGSEERAEPEGQG